MINETRFSFDSWVLETYDALRKRLFDGNGTLRDEYCFSGYHTCYVLVKPWRQRVRDLEDIRAEVNPKSLAAVRAFLDNPTEENENALIDFITFPQGELAAHVVGFVRVQAAMQKYKEGMSLDDAFAWSMGGEGSRDFYHSIKECYIETRKYIVENPDKPVSKETKRLCVHMVPREEN